MVRCATAHASELLVVHQSMLSTSGREFQSFTVRGKYERLKQFLPVWIVLNALLCRCPDRRCTGRTRFVTGKDGCPYMVLHVLD